MNTLSSAADVERRQLRDFRVLMGVLFVLLTVANAVIGPAAHFTGSGQRPNVWMMAAFLGALLWYCRWRPLPRLVDSCELAIWAILYLQALSVTMQIAGRTPRPLVDESLWAVDAAMHFSTLDIVRAVIQWPAVHNGLSVAYALVYPMVIAALILPALVGELQTSRRFIVGVIAGAMLTVVIFALWPAAGPWTTEGYPPSAAQRAVTEYLRLLKSPASIDLNRGDAGIVAFPSFHVFLAMTSAVALNTVRRLRAVGWTLGVLILISTLTTGWHYLTDVIGGLLLTVLATVAARIILPTLSARGNAEAPQVDLSVPAMLSETQISRG